MGDLVGGAGEGDEPGVAPGLEVVLGVGLLVAAGLSFVLFETLDPVLDEAGGLEPVLKGVFFVAQVGAAGAGLWFLGRGIGRGADLPPPAETWERAAGAGGLLVVAAGSSGLVRFGGPFPEPLEFVFFVLVPSVLVWAAGFVALWRPGRDHVRAAQVAAGGYVLVGLATTLTGIPGYVGPGAPFLLPFWPAYWLWLHECTFGVGIWPCP